MSSLTPTSSTSDAAAPVVAALVLDATGHIVAAGAAAHAFWGVASPALVGAPFVRFFQFEIVSQEPDWIEAQWAALLATAENRAAAFTARLADGSTRAVLLCLETSTGLPDRILATVQVAPAAASPAATADAHDSFALLAAHSPIGFFDLDMTTGRVQYSPAWKKMLGYVNAELPDTHEAWLAQLHPDDSSAAPFQLGRKVATGPRPFDVEFRLRHRLGHYVWIHCLGLQIVGDDNQLTRVIGLHLDITERKETEEASIAGDIRLQQLTTGGPLGAFELDYATQTFWFSPAWKRLLGYAEDELGDDANTFPIALPRADLEAGAEAWLLNRAPGQSSFLEPVRLQCKDGSSAAFLLGGLRILNRKRELVRFTGFICAQPAALAATIAQSPGALAEEALAALAEGVILADPRGKILALNAAATRLLQLTPEQAVGQPSGDIFRLVHRQSGQPADDVCEQALAAEGALPLSSAHALAVGDAAPVPVVWSARAVFDATGKIRGVVIVFRNPDEMSLTPEELVKANRFESLGLLAGGIAHDFNNLLTTILGAVSLAKDNRDYSALADAEQACLTAKGLTKQLLLFAKGGAGARTVSASPDILRDSVKIAAAASTAEIALEAADETWPVEVDRSQIIQVFQNLIVNALQAMPPEPHRARLQIRTANLALAADQVPPLPAGDYVEFEVRDNGSGIKPEHLEKIFDPFFTTKKHGTGLGLATVLSIVRKHGGQISVGSTVGVGTVFTVYLPRADQPVEVQARRPASLRFGTGRVLFMDDDEKITALTATMLQSLDYKFDLAKNGDEAITLYKRYLNIGRPYDAVIMDLTVIGGMGGEECFKVLRELDPDVRAIVSSGYDNDDMARRYLDMGFCGYLAKPYRVTDLGKVLKTVLG